MNICNICGSSMKPLFTGFYCPKDCDRPRSLHSWERYKDTNWYYIELKIGDRIPDEATHGWWMDGTYDATIDRAMECSPWALSNKTLPDQTTPTHRPLAVFKKI